MAYIALVDDKTVKIVTEKSGNLKAFFSCTDANGNGPTHAIVTGRNVSVYFPDTTVRVYTLTGSIVSWSGSAKRKANVRQEPDTDVASQRATPRRRRSPQNVEQSIDQTFEVPDEILGERVPPSAKTALMWIKAIFGLVMLTPVLVLVVVLIYKMIVRH